MINTSFAPTYTIDILSLERDVDTGFVKRVIWILDASYTKPSVGISTVDLIPGDESNEIIYKVQSQHECKFEREYDDDGNTIPLPVDFIEYENLEKEIVLNWVSDTIPEQIMNEYKSALKNKIIRRMYPQVLSGIPW